MFHQTGPADEGSIAQDWVLYWGLGLAWWYASVQIEAREVVSVRWFSLGGD